MIPTLLFLGLFAYSQAQTCVPETQPIGSFGQGVPRIDGTSIQIGSPYSMIDIDGAAQMPSGIITGLEYRVFRFDRVTFQVWRPLDILKGRFQLIAAVDLNPTEVEGVIERNGLSIPVQSKDRWGFSYNGNGLNVPVKYSIVLNEPNQEPYMALECMNGCATGTRVDEMATFPTRKVQKQFRMRAMMATVVSTCAPPTPPPVTPPPVTLPPVTPTPGECISPDRQPAPEARLRADLFKNYNPDVRPADLGETIQLRLVIRPREILSFDGDALKLKFYLDQRWRDNHLTWCPEDHYGITNIKFKAGKVWIPDVTQHSLQWDPGMDVMGNLESDGSILYIAIKIWEFPCVKIAETETSKEFNCTVQVESWVYTGQQLDFVLPEGWIDQSVLQEHAKVKIISTSTLKADIVYPCCPDTTYPTIYPSIVIRVPKTDRSHDFGRDM